MTVHFFMMSYIILELQKDVLPFSHDCTSYTNSFNWWINYKWRHHHRKCAPNTVMHGKVMFTWNNLYGKLYILMTKSQKTHVIKLRGAFRFCSFWVCCLSILIGLSFDFQPHNIILIHVVIVWFCQIIHLKIHEMYVILRDAFVKVRIRPEAIQGRVCKLSCTWWVCLIWLYVAWYYHIHCGLRLIVEYLELREVFVCPSTVTLTRRRLLHTTNAH